MLAISFDSSFEQKVGLVIAALGVIAILGMFIGAKRAQWNNTTMQSESDSIFDDAVPVSRGNTTILPGERSRGIIDVEPPLASVQNTRDSKPDANMSSRTSEATRLARSQSALGLCEINCSTTEDPLLKWMRRPASTRASNTLDLEDVLKSHSEKAIVALRDYLAATGSEQLQELLELRPDLKTTEFVTEFTALYQLLFKTSGPQTAQFWLKFSSVLQ